VAYSTAEDKFMMIHMWLILVLFIFSASILHYILIYIAIPGYVHPNFICFGHKTAAMFDLWSVQHFFSGIFLSPICCFIMDPKNRSPKLFVWLVAMIYFIFSWEIYELFAETNGFGPLITTWKDGFEHWSNRLISDPLLVLIGGVTQRNFNSKKLLRVAIIYTSLWAFINVLAPTCMYIQEKIFTH